MRNRWIRTGIAGIGAALLGAGSLMTLAGDNHGKGHGRERSKFLVSTELVGYEEVPAVSTTARGRFWAWVDTKANTLTYKLTYDALEGDVTQSHVHFGQMSVNGGVSFFLCSNLGNGPAGTQPCPVGPAEVSGVITPDLIVGPAGQGIEAQAFAEVVDALRNGIAYVNVHSTKWPGGEIRGQLH